MPTTPVAPPATVEPVVPRVSEDRSTPPTTRTRTPRKSTDRQSPRRRVASELRVDTEEPSSDDVAEETQSAASSPKPPLTDEYRAWKAQTMATWRAISEHRHANLFAQPVSTSLAPNYPEAVRRPMDLASIKKRLESGAIRTTVDFERDILLMFANACMYNAVDDEVHKVGVVCKARRSSIADCQGHVRRREAHHVRLVAQGRHCRRGESRRIGGQTVS